MYANNDFIFFICTLPGLFFFYYIYKVYMLLIGLDCCQSNIHCVSYAMTIQHLSLKMYTIMENLKQPPLKLQNVKFLPRIFALSLEVSHYT